MGSETECVVSLLRRRRFQLDGARLEPRARRGESAWSSGEGQVSALGPEDAMLLQGELRF